MAIYQFYLGAVPKSALIEKHGQIPSKVGVSTESGYFESDIGMYWKLVKIDPKEIISEIDKIVKRGDWGGADKFFHGWKSGKKQADNDAWMDLKKDSGNIENLYFRADLREEKLVFLKNMIELGKQFDWLFMDRKGVIIEPNFSAVWKRILVSDNFKFLDNPVQYLRSLKS